MRVGRMLVAVAACASLPPLVRAQSRHEVTVNDTGIQAENLTSTRETPPQQFALTGTGTARSFFGFQFQGSEPLIDAPRVAHTFIYEFASPEPVPEPASVLLVGTGLLVAAARKWRQRKA